jgi:hypothetical protein
MKRALASLGMTTAANCWQTITVGVLPGEMRLYSASPPRLTNLMQLTLDASWWTRYRSSGNNRTSTLTPFSRTPSPDWHPGSLRRYPEQMPT